MLPSLCLNNKTSDRKKKPMLLHKTEVTISLMRVQPSCTGDVICLHISVADTDLYYLLYVYSDVGNEARRFLSV